MDNAPDNLFKLQALRRLPTVDDLVGVMRVAAQKPAVVICLPFVPVGSGRNFFLAVTFPSNGGEPKWVLNAGNEGQVVAAHSTGDVVLIHELIVGQCGAEPPSPVDDFAVKSIKGKVPKTARGQAEESVEPGSSWNKLRRAANEATQRLSQPLPVYDPRAAEQLRLRDNDPAAEPEPGKSTEKNANLLVGDLLVAAELISREDLVRLMPLVRQTGLPIGRILVESGVVTESLVRAAVMSQSLMRDRLLHFQMAVNGLKMSAEQGLTFDHALKELGWHREYFEVANKLGQLLMDARCVTSEQLAGANEVCFASGLPLGRVLVLRKVIPEVVAYAALSVQVLLREGKLTRKEAIVSIADAASINSSVQDWLKQDGALNRGKNNSIRLGELLILAGILSELDLLSAVESSLTQKALIGQVLVKTEIISQPVLEQALKLQKAVNSQLLSPMEAARSIRELHQSRHSKVSQADASSNLVDQELKKLLSSLGATDGEGLKSVLQTILQQKENLAFRLVSEQEELKHKLARDLHDTIIADVLMLKRYLSGDKKLSTEQIIEILDYIVLQMREICNDFVPKQLSDWGLKLAIADLVERVGRRSGIYCQTDCQSEIPKLPDPVQLHVFRIVQEWINNVEKYSNASRLDVKIEQPDAITLKIILQDNGKGFENLGVVDPRTSEGGRGIPNLKERVDLIRCYFFAKLTIESQPGAGARLELEIRRSG